MKPPMASLEARESAGGGEPGAYLPVRTPWARGDQTICEMPLSRHSGMISASGARHRREYCGWLETKRSTPDIAMAARTLSAGHSEKPM